MGSKHDTSLVVILGLAAILGVIISITRPEKKTEILAHDRKSRIVLNVADGVVISEKEKSNKQAASKSEPEPPSPKTKE